MNVNELKLYFKSISETEDLVKILGPSTFNNDSNQSIIRKIVHRHFLILFTIPLFIISLIPPFYLINSLKGFHISLIILYFIFIFINSTRNKLIEQASIIWAYFKNNMDLVEDNDIQIVCYRFLTYFRIYENLGKVILLIHLITIILCIYNYGLIKGILLEILILIISFAISYKISRKSITKFKLNIKNNFSILNEEYIFNWKNDRVDRLSYIFKETNGGYFILFYLSLLIFLKYLFPENFWYNLYFFSLFFLIGILILFAHNAKKTKALTKFRKPSNIIISKLLSRYVFGLFFFDTLWGIVSIFGIYKVLTNSFDYNWIILIPITVIVETVNRFFTSKFSLLMIKRIIDKNFNIVVFRKFNIENLSEAKNNIYPILGTYGKIISIQDDNLKNLRSNFVSSDIFGEYNSLEYSTTENWKFNVEKYIRIGDYVVFYWTNLPTENMLWEFEFSQKHIPLNRQLIIGKDNLSSINILLKKHYPSIELNNLNFIDLNEINSHGKFRNKFYDLMKILVEEKTPNLVQGIA